MSDTDREALHRLFYGWPMASAPAHALTQAVLAAGFRRPTASVEADQSRGLRPLAPEGIDALDDLVARFSAALLAKLKDARAKYDHEESWLLTDWRERCLDHMHQHIAKGDPRDVAAYCAFLWHHGWRTEPSRAAAAPPTPEGFASALKAERRETAAWKAHAEAHAVDAMRYREAVAHAAEMADSRAPDIHALRGFLRRALRATAQAVKVAEPAAAQPTPEGISVRCPECDGAGGFMVRNGPPEDEDGELVPCQLCEASGMLHDDDVQGLLKSMREWQQRATKAEGELASRAPAPPTPEGLKVTPAMVAAAMEAFEEAPDDYGNDGAMWAALEAALKESPTPSRPEKE